MKAEIVALKERRRYLSEAVHDRTVEIDAALLSLRGLHDAISQVSAEFEKLEQAMNDKDAEPIGSNIHDVTAQLEEFRVCILRVFMMEILHMCISL